MTEIKKTLAILKARWPEVALIIGLNVLSLLLNKLLLIMQSKIMPMQGLIDFGYFLLFLLILMILTVGFQRTVCLQGKQRQSPTILLRTGWHFLGRIFKLGAIWLLIYCFLVWLTFLVIKKFTSIETGFFETAQSFPLLYQFCFVVPGLILIKPGLFIPALIIALDCGISKSFKLLKQCKLLHARELIILFLISMAGTFLWTFLPSIKSATTISQYILIVAWSAIQHFIGLMIAVMAVRFVASLHLEYDNQPSSLDFEDLRK